ncbi:glutathione-independent formaldehyde dehydrogenase [Pseudokineococcus sp. 5B2Z-1]|uniref:glutathione-independent formaldehyde dehydrogenase n=1 Tax=Pseudokineococcus sp. 5B2Z-1 TaxID=3132744 RepID=UPI003094DF1C
MRALVYNGPKDVSVVDVPDAKIEAPTDAVVKITTTNICGSDLHMYEGRTDVEQGKVLGHENMGVVEEVGPGVTRLKKGDRVSLPFNIACGHCRNCTQGKTAFCLEVNPGSAGGAYGYADMGPYSGGQAEYLRVPFADFNALRLPGGTEHENDFTMLSDIFPTGWHGTRLAGLQPGDSVAIMGAGPVGLMAALSARIQGADQVYVVDQQADRLRLAEQVGATPVDFSKGPAEEQIMEATKGVGVDRGVEAVGWQAHDHSGDEHPAGTLDTLVEVVRATGGIGVVGVFPPADPNGPDPDMQEGRLRFPFGQFFFKGQSMGTGQCNTKAYNRQLRDLIIAGKAEPSFIVSHELSLEEAASGYEHFDNREDGWTKVLLHP